MSYAIEKSRNFAVESLPRADQRQMPLAGGAVSALPRGFVEASTQEEVLADTGRKLVAQTFFATMLKQMRESPFKSDIFSGGRGEQAFGPMYDAILAERMSRGAGDKLVRPIVNKYLKQAKSAYEKQKEQGLVAANRRA